MVTPKRRAGDLLDGAAAQIAVGIGLETRLVFAAFAGVGHAAEAVHGDGEGFVRFLADRAEAHGASGEALDDFLGRLDLFDGEGRLSVFELEKSAQGAEVAVLVIDEVGVLLESGRVVIADSMLHLADGERIEEVIFAALAVLILAANDEVGFGVSEGLEGVGVLHLRFASEHVEADAFDARGGAGEVALDERPVEADGLKDLGAAIALQGADAHLGEGLEQALLDGLDEVLFAVLGSNVIGQHAAVLEVVDGLDGEVGIDGAGAVADEQCEVHDFARLTALNDERDLGAGFFLDEAIVNGSHREQAGNGRIGGVDAAVGEDQQGVAGVDGE